jgi:CRISPR-associated exonuclease Cas4
MQTVFLSALQHYLFCPRQCALIHVEQIWADNVYTERGHRQHKRVDTPRAEMRTGIRHEFALPLWASELGISGVADAVEFEADGTPYPVEHKVGRKLKLSDQIQLCAQALCLEEMFGKAVPEGALYYFGLRSRKKIPLSPQLRSQTLEVIEATRTLLERGAVPAAIWGDYCEGCSLQDVCLPKAVCSRGNRFKLD